MDDSRHAVLRQSLAERLETAEPRVRSRPDARARWVATQLENYVERWLAFSTVSTTTAEGLTRGNLFGALVVGNRTLGEIVAELPDGHPARAAWAKFNAQVESIQRDARTVEAERLRPMLAIVAEALVNR